MLLRKDYTQTMRCEDYPCCGHTDHDPCPGQFVPDEPWYCDDCGIDHYGLTCPVDEYDEDEGEPWEDGIDYAWEAEYHAHSSSITGIYEAP